MRIVRFVEASTGRILTGALRDDRTAELLDGPFPEFAPTGQVVAIGRLLAPIIRSHKSFGPCPQCRMMNGQWPSQMNLIGGQAGAEGAGALNRL